ncbi:MAG: LON peptidase substrate-binding domain-containing protein, partial [bacterium]|nr:LON peptidase substrate-binding domain-containing protein [bacterium]
MSEFKKEYSTSIPTILPVIPLRNEVLFPQQFLPITVAREKSLKLLADINKEENIVAILAQKNAVTEDPDAKDLHIIGTAAKIMRTIDMPDGSKTILIQGLYRLKLITFSQEQPFFKAIFEPIRNENIKIDDPDRVSALSANLRNIFKRVVELSSDITYEQLVMISNIKDPGMLADMTTAFSG